MALPAARLAGRRLPIALPGWCHLFFLAAIGWYLSVFYPASTPALLFLFATGFLAELSQNLLRRFLVGESLVVIGAVLSYFMVDFPREDFVGWSRMVVAAILLVPSRQGSLRTVRLLMLFELIILGIPKANLSKPEFVPRAELMPFLGWKLSPLVFLIPIALASMAADAWLRGVDATRGRTHVRMPPSRWLLRWTAVPVVLVAVVALTLGPFLGGLVTPGRGLSGVPGVNPARSPVLPTECVIGSQGEVGKSPHLMAKLIWEKEPLVSNAMYLRLLTMPRMSLRHDELVWGSRPDGALRTVAPATIAAKTSWAWIYRKPCGLDSLVRPDHSAGVEWSNPAMEADRDGNLTVPGIDRESFAIYRSEIGDDLGPVEPDIVADDYRGIVAGLDAMPWREIEKESWRRMNPEDAANAIAKVLRERCTYATEHLPAPAPGTAGSLRRFLFGDSADRRGHCQYFASAATILLRRAGHPARFVVGFASNETFGGDGGGNSGYLFRALHAHAWSEVLTRGQRWQRVDATPPSAILALPPGIDPGDEAAVELPKPGTTMTGPADDPLTAAARAWWPWTLAAAVVLAGLFWWYRSAARRAASGLDARQAAAQRQAETLYRLAQTLGMVVGPATTLTALVARLRERTGIDLAVHLAAHLAARFGDGPVPPPWPLDDLRAAAARDR